MKEIKEFIIKNQKIIYASLIVYNFYPIIGLIFKEKAGQYMGFLDLVLINPLFIVVFNLIIAELYGKDYKQSLLIPLLFIPSLIIFYGLRSLGFLFIYILISLLFNYIGYLIKKNIIDSKKSV